MTQHENSRTEMQTKFIVIGSVCIALIWGFLQESNIFLFFFCVA